MSDEHKTADTAEYPDEETKSILAEMESDKSVEEKPDEEPESEPEEEDDKSESKDDDEEKLEDDTDTGTDNEKEPKEPKTPEETVPLSKYMSLKRQLNNLTKGEKREVQTLIDTPSLSNEEIEVQLEAIADKYGTDPNFVKDLKNTLLSPKLLETLNLVQHQAVIKNQEEQYDNEFRTKVLPLIKEEYGEDVSKDVIKRIKTAHKQMSFSKDLLNTPADLIYSGVKSFRGYGDKATAESSGNRRTRGGDTVIDFKNMTMAEATKTLSDEDFEKWSNYQEELEKKNRSNN